MILAVAAGAAIAETPAVEAWRTSPFHGVTGGNGKTIPCLCVFRGRDYKLGERVCMQTPDGIRITRCDLVLNNTSWIPTDEPCTMSMRPDTAPQSKKS